MPNEASTFDSMEAAPSTRGSGTFTGRRCRLRKTSLLVAFYSDASYLSKFTEFTFMGDTSVKSKQ